MLFALVLPVLSELLTRLLVLSPILEVLLSLLLGTGEDPVLCVVDAVLLVDTGGGGGVTRPESALFRPAAPIVCTQLHLHQWVKTKKTKKSKSMYDVYFRKHCCELASVQSMRTNTHAHSVILDANI